MAVTGVVVEDSEACQRALCTVLLGLLQEQAQREHVLRDLTVRQSLPCARSDLESADHPKIRQSRHPSPVTITVNISWTMDAARHVDAGLTKHDGVQFDLATPELVSEAHEKGSSPCKMSRQVCLWRIVRV
jgi:hypothetical protein